MPERASKGPALPGLFVLPSCFERNTIMRELPKDLASQVHAAIREDVGTGDVTAGFVPENQLAHGRVITREAAVMCGRPWVEEVFRQIDEGVRLRWHANDGERINPAQNLFDTEGSARSILTGERTALNFLQMLSAVADRSAALRRSCSWHGLHDPRYPQDVAWAPHGAEVRRRVRGAANHRMGLFDMVLVKRITSPRRAR